MSFRSQYIEDTSEGVLTEIASGLAAAKSSQSPFDACASTDGILPIVSAQFCQRVMETPPGTPCGHHEGVHVTSTDVTSRSSPPKVMLAYPAALQVMPHTRFRGKHFFEHVNEYVVVRSYTHPSSVAAATDMEPGEGFGKVTVFDAPNATTVHAVAFFVTKQSGLLGGASPLGSMWLMGLLCTYRYTLGSLIAPMGSFAVHRPSAGRRSRRRT